MSPLSLISPSYFPHISLSSLLFPLSLLYSLYSLLFSSYLPSLSPSLLFPSSTPSLLPQITITHTMGSPLSVNLFNNFCF
jgi:hypothetical protein